MLVIGTVGRKGSGKDTALDYLAQRCDLPVVVVGDIAREIAEERGVEPTRENLHEISQEYMARHGKDFFMRQVVERLRRRGWSAAGISGIRSPADVRVLREALGDRLLLVAVIVGDARLRFERTKARDDPRDPDTWQEFLEGDQKAEEMFNLGQAIEEAELRIRNDGSLEELERQLEQQIIEDRLADEVACD